MDVQIFRQFIDRYIFILHHAGNLTVLGFACLARHARGDSRLEPERQFSNLQAMLAEDVGI